QSDPETSNESEPGENIDTCELGCSDSENETIPVRNSRNTGTAYTKSQVHLAPKSKKQNPTISTRKDSVDQQSDQASDGEEFTQIIAFKLKCIIDGCAELVKDRPALYEHLFAKHNVHRYRCLVQGCSQSFRYQ